MQAFTAWLSFVTLGTAAACSAAPPPAAAALAGSEPGARIYNGNCIACHQPDARGIPGVYPSLVGSRVVLGDPADFALWIAKGRRPAGMPADAATLARVLEAP